MIRKPTLAFGAAALLLGASLPGARNVVVYRAAGRYGGWPANHGIWSWGGEIVVGFELGYFKPNGGVRHAIDWERPAEHVLARSLDGGETWTLERPASLQPPAGTKIAGVPTARGGKAPVDCDEAMDFTAPGFALTARMEDANTGPSRYYWSTDRGRTWNGPCKIGNFGQRAIAARTDYLVDGKRTLTMFLTAAKPTGKEGRVICVRTTDGGRSWKLIGFLGPEPPDGDWAIMPSSVRLSAETIVTAIRHPGWIEMYRSEDNGATWRYWSRPAETGARGGNPPSLVRLRDGRLALTYGYRSEPYSIRARVSADEGKTWSRELMLRSGGAWDLGYTRSVERPDGRVVTAYYICDRADEERYIGATIWDPSQAK